MYRSSFRVTSKWQKKLFSVGKHALFLHGYRSASINTFNNNRKVHTLKYIYHINSCKGRTILLQFWRGVALTWDRTFWSKWCWPSWWHAHPKSCAYPSSGHLVVACESTQRTKICWCLHTALGHQTRLLLQWKYCSPNLGLPSWGCGPCTGAAMHESLQYSNSALGW